MFWSPTPSYPFERQYETECLKTKSSSMTTTEFQSVLKNRKWFRTLEIFRQEGELQRTGPKVLLALTCDFQRSKLVGCSFLFVCLFLWHKLTSFGNCISASVFKIPHIYLIYIAVLTPEATRLKYSIFSPIINGRKAKNCPVVMWSDSHVKLFGSDRYISCTNNCFFTHFGGESGPGTHCLTLTPMLCERRRIALCTKVWMRKWKADSRTIGDRQEQMLSMLLKERHGPNSFKERRKR